MQTTWILAADSSRARIFEVAEKDRRLLEIQDFVNPEARMSEREFYQTGKPRMLVRR